MTLLSFLSFLETIYIQKVYIRGLLKKRMLAAFETSSDSLLSLSLVLLVA